MTSKLLRAYWLTCISMIFGAAASATTIILPTDAQLIAKSPVIVAGTVLRSTPVSIGEKIWTETTLQIDRTFKGGVAGEITIRELGGVIDDRITKIFGAPEYTPGERVLAFLTPTPRGDFQTSISTSENSPNSGPLRAVASGNETTSPPMLRSSIAISSPSKRATCSVTPSDSNST